ncbi:MAG: Flp pilus assembly complex ATPase component TadA [Deltaproteobacteria bacterium]|nr:Flp pilus assembly complex ATPase component TadA [Deltaproteobacteria bacterium]
MARIDAYLRSVERFGADAVIMQSNQTVTLRFASGDRHATQTTSHEQLVAMVREIAPPAALDLIDAGRPARFELDGASGRFTVAVAPRGAQWIVQIEPIAPVIVAAPPPPAPAWAPPPAPADAEMTIERTQHDVFGRTGSWLDEQIRAARAAGASDLHLAASARPIVRIAGRLAPLEQPPVDAEQLIRELALLPGAAEGTDAVDLAPIIHVVAKVARCRVRRYEDRGGPGAAIRMHPIEPPDAHRLGLPAALIALAERRHGLIVVASPAGGGRTTTLGALIEHIAARGGRVIAFERTAELDLEHRRGLVSPRVLGEPATQLATTQDEDADAIAIGDLAEPQAIATAIDLAAGRLVLLTVPEASTSAALARLAAGAVGNARLARVLAGASAQALCPRAGRERIAVFEVAVATEAVQAAVRHGAFDTVAALVDGGRAAGMVSLAQALADLVRARQITVDDAFDQAPDPAALRAALAEG